MAGRKTDAGGDPWFEVAFGRFYAELYAHRDDSEAETLLQTLEPHLPTVGPVLDLACGAGRLLHPLRRRYLGVVGLDLSVDLLRLAREGGPDLRLVRADMRFLPFTPGCFGAVFSLFTSFGYFADPAEDRRALEEVAQCLRAGGIYVLDFLNASQAVEDLVPHSRQRIGGRDVESLRSYDPSTQVVRKVVRVHEGGELVWEYEERVRAYRPSQLDELLATVGLEVIRRYGNYDGGPFDEATSPRYVLVGRRGNA